MKSMQNPPILGYISGHYLSLGVLTHWISVSGWLWQPCAGLENHLTGLTENDWMDVSTR